MTIPKAGYQHLLNNAALEVDKLLKENEELRRKVQDLSTEDSVAWYHRYQNTRGRYLALRSAITWHMHNNKEWNSNDEKLYDEAERVDLDDWER